MEARNVVAGVMRGLDLGDDVVEREWCGVDAARAGRAMLEHRRGDQRACVEADGRRGDQVAAAQGEQVGRAGACTDEVNGHAGSP